ncbi:MAG TPA: DNA primase [Planctomycetota bacterium]|nr:DNA primase [Planctomycetota bacterium]
MALIADETILEIKRAVDIVEIVSGYFPLKRAGSNYKALCPFHDEKTPSFNVNPERQIFICFGCGKKGDVITFVMEQERVDYPEAIRILADKAGVRIRYRDGSGPEGVGREDLYRVNEWAAGVFRALLKTAPEAGEARAFLERRGVKEETAELFRLGFSMPAWEDLLGRARRAGFSEELLVAAGLAVPREGRGGCYDRFRGRVMFPITAPQGRVVGFGARTLGEEQPKFLNSPETAVFSKGRGFYGLSWAREELERTRTVYIVEGYLDVVVPYQAGVRGLVATLGTALTRDHLKVLRRYADKVVLVFDADAAGQKASERGLDLLLSENMDVFVAELPAGMDPDDVVLKHGPERLRECLERPREIFDFLMAALSARHGEGTPAAKARIVEEMIERLGRIPDPVKRELLLQALAARFGLEERTLRARLERAAADAESRAGEGGDRGPAPEGAEPPAARAAREALACALADPGCAARLRHEVPPERYPTETLRKLAEAAYALFDRTEAMEGRELLAALREPALIEEAAGILAIEVTRETAPGRFRGAREALEREFFLEESRRLRARLRNATPEEEVELLRRVMEARRARPRDHGLFPGR